MGQKIFIKMSSLFQGGVEVPWLHRVVVVKHGGAALEGVHLVSGSPAWERRLQLWGVARSSG